MPHKINSSTIKLWVLEKYIVNHYYLSNYKHRYIFYVITLPFHLHCTPVLIKNCIVNVAYSRFCYVQFTTHILKYAFSKIPHAFRNCFKSRQIISTFFKHLHSNTRNEVWRLINLLWYYSSESSFRQSLFFLRYSDNAFK